MPQPSSPPERQNVKLRPDRSSYRSKCMYIHKDTLKSFTNSNRMASVFRPPDRFLAGTDIYFGQMPDSSSSSSPGVTGSPPLIRGQGRTVRPPGLCVMIRAISILAYKRVEPPDKGMRMVGSVRPPGVTPQSIFIQSNMKSRPFFNQSSWTVPVTWRSSERKST